MQAIYLPGASTLQLGIFEKMLDCQVLNQVYDCHHLHQQPAMN